jgi:hypothetical protein
MKVSSFAAAAKSLRTRPDRALAQRGCHLAPSDAAGVDEARRR